MSNINLDNYLVALEISGDDATKYLQGQLTNDINLLDNQEFQLSAHLNIKGRILASFIITKFAKDSYYLIMSRDLVDKILPRLKMFVLRSKVSIIISLKHLSLTNYQDNNNKCILLSIENYLVISDNNPQIDLVDDQNSWKQFLVEKTLPFIYLATYEKIIPQQIDYDLMNAINFKKGCYTGQEIIARTHYLGKVKRRLFKFQITQQPQIGDTIVSPKLNNQEVGFIIDYYEKANNFIGLASIQIDCADNCYLDTQNNFKLDTQQIHG